MHVDLHPRYTDDREAHRAGGLINACVHCGFCLATCPTYLDSGDERDSPRGRIYLVKQLLEEGKAGAATRTHLDRCLTCRSCETTCPSGMQYGRMLDIGRGILEREAPRPLGDRLFRLALRNVLSRPVLLAGLLRLGQWLRPALPGLLSRKIPPRQDPGALPPARHPRRMLALTGCVQRAATPATHAAAARVLDRLGISLVTASGAGCCGAVDYHLGAHDDGRNHMRRNIDAWWPHVSPGAGAGVESGGKNGAEAGVEAIVSSATGCGGMVADYGEALADDPDYADKAQRIAALHRDIAEVISAEDIGALALRTDIGRVAVHIPCSQQHGLRQPAVVESLLTRAGFQLAETKDKHLCCGSAGTYSILQRERAERLRTRKLAALTPDQPVCIVTANVGCQLHLAGASAIPVHHWIELLDRGD